MYIKINFKNISTNYNVWMLFDDDSNKHFKKNITF